MKFGALLRTSAEETPELAGLFVAYKQLKKKLKALPVAAGGGGAAAAGSEAEEAGAGS